MGVGRVITVKGRLGAFAVMIVLRAKVARSCPPLLFGLPASIVAFENDTADE